MNRVLSLGGLLVCFSWASFGQDLIFANNAATTITNNLTGQPATSLTVGLYVGPLGTEESSLALYAGAVTNLFLPGRFQGGIRQIAYQPWADWPDIAIQVRAWGSGYSSYEDAYTASLSNDSILLGRSNPFFIRLDYAPGAPLPLFAAGLLPFTVAPIPEPSAVALLVLGILVIGRTARPFRQNRGVDQPIRHRNI